MSVDTLSPSLRGSPNSSESALLMRGLRESRSYPAMPTHTSLKATVRGCLPCVAGWLSIAACTALDMVAVATSSPVVVLPPPVSRWLHSYGDISLHVARSANSRGNLPVKGHKRRSAAASSRVHAENNRLRTPGSSVDMFWLLLSLSSTRENPEVSLCAFLSHCPYLRLVKRCDITLGKAWAQRGFPIKLLRASVSDPGGLALGPSPYP